MKPHLQLLANPQGWRSFISRKSDPSFAKITEKIWQRDHWTCQFCGIQAKSGLDLLGNEHNARTLDEKQSVLDVREHLHAQHHSLSVTMSSSISRCFKEGLLEVVNLDQDYTHNELSNLATACSFCTQCGFLESLGIGSYGGGSLIYLPEITQDYLNGFCHILFRAIASQTEQQDTGQQQYRRLKLRSQVIEEKLGNGLSDPAVFGQLLIESNLNYKDNAWLTCLRLLPSRAAFKTQVEQWIATETSS